VPEVCACVLQELKTRAEQFFGEPAKQAVITVPANADDAQREQTRIAGRIAGLEVLRLLNEPTAAALAYALGGVRGDRMVVYDFGGGTFDCSVIAWGKDTATVLATHGDTFLGGDDIDLAIAERVAAELRARTGVDVKREVSEWKRLLFAAEVAKRSLSAKPSTRIQLKEVGFTDAGPVHLDYELDRETFDELVGPLVQQTVDLMLDAVALGGLEMKDAGLEPKDVDEVVLVGGSSRLPQVRKAVTKAVGRVPLLVFDPDTVVAIGAAIEAQRVVGGRSPNLGLAPRELVEVVPHSIGLATAGGGFDPVILRNSRLPASGQRSYTTWRDNQQEMRFVVLQGDSERAIENARLGEFIVANLPARKAGQVEVKLLFEVNSDGLLRASARDTTTNRVHRYRVRVADALRAE
jgi:molecular chaperone DnaK